MPKDAHPALPHKVSMQIEVQDVIQFMQDNVCPYRLVSVARAVAGMAPILWGHHRQEEIIPLRIGIDMGALMHEDSMSGSLQADATLSACRVGSDLDGGDGPGQEGVLVP